MYSRGNTEIKLLLVALPSYLLLKAHFQMQMNRDDKQYI